MGMLSNIFNKIFPPSHPAVVKTDKTATTQPAPTISQSATITKTATTTAPKATPPIQRMEEIDVEQMLDAKNQTEGQTLNWRYSIVDLLKLLDLDNSLQAR